MNISKAPVVTLTNGLRVANFSSPHPFNFEDGSVLEACNPDRVKAGELKRQEDERAWGGLDRDDIVAVVPKFSLSNSVWELLVELENDKNVDIVLVPFPVLEVLRSCRSFKMDLLGDLDDIEVTLLDKLSKVGTICVKDRTTKAIFINRFCR